VLNDAKVRAAKPQQKPYKLTDSHRLYLLVKPNGSKLWKWNYSYDGKQKTMSLWNPPDGQPSRRKGKTRRSARAP
jgi:hypothetical protein